MRVLAQTADPLADDLAHALGQPDVREIDGGDPAPLLLADGAGLGQVAHHLLGEERVAVGLAADGVGELDAVGWHLVAGEPLEQRDDAVVVEAAEAHALDTGLASQRGQPLGQRVARWSGRCRGTSR